MLFVSITQTCKLLACENIRFSSLFAAGNISGGGTSATQRQKFHTDDANHTPPHETSPVAKSEEKRMFLQASILPAPGLCPPYYAMLFCLF